MRDFSNNLADLLEKNWWFHILHLIERQSSQLPVLPFFELDRDRVKVIAEYANQEAQRQQLHFPKLFADACEEAGIPLDASPHPRYTTDHYFIEIIIDDRKRTARIENYVSELATLPMDISAVVQKLKETRTRLFDRDFNASEFIDNLYTDYLAVKESEQIRDGEAVSIRSITKLRRKDSKSFRVDEFSVDVSRLLQSGTTTTSNGYRLRFEQTKNTSQGIIVPGGQGYIGYIRFDK
jgi:hypothetical protein